MLVYGEMLGFPHSSVGKESACNAGDRGLIPGWERSSGEQNGNPLQYSLAWRIPWTQEPMRLQSMGVARVGRNLEAKPPPNQSCLVILLARAAGHAYLLKDNWEALKLVEQVA